MIFVTVGSMLPFDRLTRIMDTWAIANPAADVVAQIGEGEFVPTACRWQRMISPAEFDRLCEEAEVIVAHAGMGTIFSVLQSGRPLVILPRRAELREVTTNHQVATAAQLGGRLGITVVNEAQSLWRILDQKEYRLEASRISRTASPELIDRVRTFMLSA